jgi:hypothetical protein
VNLDFTRIHQDAIVCACDEALIPRDGYKHLAAISPSLEREYQISNRRNEISKYMETIIPIFNCKLKNSFHKSDVFFSRSPAINFVTSKCCNIINLSGPVKDVQSQDFPLDFDSKNWKCVNPILCISFSIKILVIFLNSFISIIKSLNRTIH